MANISLRGIDSEVLAQLKDLAAKENASVNTLVLRLIDQGLGREPGKPLRRRHDDLEYLAGSWSEAEAAEFAQATSGFSEVDIDLWK